MTRFLIEEGLPFYAVNEASHREKAGTGFDHPRRLHMWWARRPLAMSRAVVLGSILPDPGETRLRHSYYEAIAAASRFQDISRQSVIRPLRDLVAAAYPDRPPRVLDCFAGGGAIPLEALRVGCDVVAVDLNPIAHLIERCMLEYPQKFASANALGANQLAQRVEHWATWVGERARERLSACYPVGTDGSRPNVWFWARTMVCENPGCALEIPLVRSWWLAKGRRGARVWLTPHIAAGTLVVELGQASDALAFDPSIGTMKASSVTCPACGATSSSSDVRRYGKSSGFGIRLLATLAGDRSAGEYIYRVATEADLNGAIAADTELPTLADFDDGYSPFPDENLDPAQYRKFGMLPYGLDSYRDLFTPRQLLAASSLCAATREAYGAMLASGLTEEEARVVTTYISLIIDRIVVFNSSFASWDITRESIRNTYSRQSIPMVWDFTEIDPFSNIPGNWWSGIRATTSVIGHCAQTAAKPAEVIRGDAQNLRGLDDASFDAVIVDPPYYDAMQYGDLSDFFYVWQKRAIGFLYPELFATPLTPKGQEVIENRADRRSQSYISSDEFERRLGAAIAEMRRVVKADGVVTIVFAHTESDAWERLLRSLLQAGLVVSTSWPMQSEMATRTTAKISAVLGSSVILVCRPRTVERLGYYDEVVRELDERISERLDEFEALGLSGADYLISAIGPAFEVFGRYSSVRRFDDEEVSVGELLALARRTVARQAMRRLLGSEGLASVDDTTLLYLTWRWAYGAARIPVDEAQKLGKAFHIEVDELGGVDGLAQTSRESYGLRGPDERKRISLGPVPAMVDVLQLACQLHESGRRRDLAELLASSGFAEETAFWSAARAITESLPDGNRERTMLVNLLGGREQVVAAAREMQPSEALRLFDEAGR